MRALYPHLQMLPSPPRLRADRVVSRAYVLGRLAALMTLIGALGTNPRAEDLVASPDGRWPTVGRTGRVEQIIVPGSELEAIPNEDRQAKLVVRIAETYRHGTDFRYDLEYQGFEPGAYNLAEYLRRKDGSTTVGIPTIPIEVGSLLAPGQIEPHGLSSARVRGLGGYGLLLELLAGAWLVGLIGIVLYGRRKKRLAQAALRAPTLADRLRPLVEQAMAGTLPTERRAELERMLIGYWERRLSLENLSAGAVWERIRQDANGGPLLLALERWLHKPPGAPEPVDLGVLLAPYQATPAGELAGEPPGRESAA